MSKSLEEILQVEAAAGPFSTGDAVIEQTLRDFIQLQSTTIAVGTQVVGVRSVSWMDFKWYTGVNGSFSFPLALSLLPQRFTLSCEESTELTLALRLSAEPPK